MKKQTAIKLLGGTAKEAAAAMNYTSVAAIHMWPDDLPTVVAERVFAAWVKKFKPKVAKEFAALQEG